MKKYSTLGIIAREYSIATKNRKITPLMVIISTICAGLLPLVGLYLSKIIIELMSEPVVDTNKVIWTIVTICSIGTIFALGKVISENILEVIFLDTRMKEFNRVNKLYLNLDYKYLEDANFRDYFKANSEALDGDYLGFQGILTQSSKFFPVAVSIISFSIIIGMFNIWIILMCIASSIIVAIANVKLGKYIASKRMERAKSNRQADYYANIAYDFSYGKDIRVYSLQKKLNSDYRKKTNFVVKVIRDIENKRFAFGLLEILGLVLEDALAYFFIIKGYFDGAISLGQVSLYIGTVIALATTFRDATDIVTEITKSKGYVKEYFKFIDDNKYYTNFGTKKCFDKGITLDIEFKNVSFKYPNTERWILRNFNFKINKGEKLAIVGTNGAGKSTIVKLITGLFEVDEGEILLNGINVKDFEKHELSKMFSVVYQDINIYPATILQNIIGDDETSGSRKLAIDCLNRVGLEEKIKSLPLQYDTPMLKVVDDNGVELSGGQNQKICIARALYKDGNMVILDEPTSALDALAEASIYKSFDDLVKDKTAIYISHRLSSTKFCDKIALFDQEGLKEYGSHDELMELKGIYYDMFMTQGKYYKEGVKQDEETCIE